MTAECMPMDDSAKFPLNLDTQSRKVPEMFQGEDDRKNPKHHAQHQSPPPLDFNEKDYLPLLDDADLSERQKREFLQTLWSIMVTLTDLQLGLDPVQQLLNEADQEPDDGGGP